MKWRKIETTTAWISDIPLRNARRPIVFLEVIETIWSIRRKEQGVIEAIFINGENHLVPSEIQMRPYRGFRDGSEEGTSGKPAEWWKEFCTQQSLDGLRSGSFIISSSDCNNPEVQCEALVTYTVEKSRAIKFSISSTMYTRKESFRQLVAVQERHMNLQLSLSGYQRVSNEEGGDTAKNSPPTSMLRKFAINSLRACSAGIDQLLAMIESP